MEPRETGGPSEGGRSDRQGVDVRSAARLAACALAAAVLGILALALSPLLLVWYYWQRAWRQAHGLRILLPSQARTLAAFAEATIPSGDPPEVWTGVARDVDHYLAGFHSPRKWRSVWLWTAIEWIPLTHGRRRFSALELRERMRYCDERFRTTRGIHGALATGRQLARLGYYSRLDTQRSLGFVPWEARGVKLDPAPGAGT